MIEIKKPTNLYIRSFDENEEDKNVTNNREIKFFWDEVKGINGYNLQISNNESFSDIINDENSISNTFNLVKGLDGGLFGKKYYWKVRAYRKYSLITNFDNIEKSNISNDIKEKIKSYYNDEKKLKDDLSAEDKKNLFELLLDNNFISFNIPSKISKDLYDKYILNSSQEIKDFINKTYKTLPNNSLELKDNLTNRDKKDLFDLLRILGINQ